MPIDQLLTDKRIQKQALAQGLLTQAELHEHLQELPDLREQVASSDDSGTRERNTHQHD